jgi:hypothetical protein
LVTKGKTVELKAVNLHKLYIHLDHFYKKILRHQSKTVLLKVVTLIISFLVYYSEESG